MVEIDRASDDSKHHFRGRLLAILIASAFIISLIATMLIAPTPSEGNPTAPDVPARITYTAHANISINGNAGFLGPNASTGITKGSGTASDPYIIENWDINSSENGIFIDHANVFFIIRNCYIHDGGPMPAGIALYYCVNGVLINNTCWNNRNGIYIGASSDITLNNNIMVGGGIIIDGSDMSQWSTHAIDISNTVNGRPVYYYKNQNGITVPAGAGQVILANCTDSIVEGQSLTYCSVGVELGFSSGITVTNNNCSSTDWIGIYLASSIDCTVSNNTCSANNYGIALHSSNSNTVSNNYCSHNQDGIYLKSSSDNTLSNDNCSNNGDGIVLWLKSTNNMIVENEMRDNYGYGVKISYDTENATSCPRNNKILNNTFVDNNGAGSSYDPNHIQALDDGVGDLWNTSGTPHSYGNYWSDWTSPDNNNDSIVDSPYVIAGTAGAKDYYPLAIAGMSTNPSMIIIAVIVIAAVLAVMAAIFVMTRKKKSPPMKLDEMKVGPPAPPAV